MTKKVVQMPSTAVLPPMPLDTRTHDIENQLAVIQGFAELLLADTAADDPRRGDYEHIRAAAVTARRLLERGTTPITDTTPRPPSRA